MKLIARLNGKKEAAEDEKWDSLLVLITTEEYDLLRDHPDFINASLYAGATGHLFTHEVGRFGDARLVIEDEENREEVELKALDRIINKLRAERVKRERGNASD